MTKKEIEALSMPDLLTKESQAFTDNNMSLHQKLRAERIARYKSP